MATRISQRELRNDNAEVMRRVEAGESFTVTRRGEPVADLVPHEHHPSDRLRYVPAGHLSSLFVDLPPWDTQKWASEQADLDDAVEDSLVDPWQ